MYLSQDLNIATVDNNGNVIGRQHGNAKIIISQTGNAQYKPTNTAITVTVVNSSTGKKKQSISSIDSYQFNNINQSKVLNAKASSGLKCTYKSSNPSIVAVDSAGKLTSKKAGTTKITITQNDL